MKQDGLLDYLDQLPLACKSIELVQRFYLYLTDQIFELRKVIAPQEYPEIRDS